MKTAGAGQEPTSGFFDQCAKIREILGEAHVITSKLVGAVPETDVASKDDSVYLNDLERRLSGILTDTNNLVKRLQEIERRF